MATVLLIDDDADNLWALQLALEGGGHHVVLASNGREALDKLARDAPALIVTDWEMPEMDGGEFCTRVRCKPAFAQVPILVLSATAEPIGGPARWSQYIRKPADVPMLLQIINTLVAARLTSGFIRREYREPAKCRWPAVNPGCWP